MAGEAHGALRDDVPVPLVPDASWRNVRAQLSTMQVGESRFFGAGTKATVRGYASRYKAQHPGWNYTTRTEDEGMRLWRTR